MNENNNQNANVEMNPFAASPATPTPQPVQQPVATQTMQPASQQVAQAPQAIQPSGQVEGATPTIATNPATIQPVSQSISQPAVPPNPQPVPQGQPVSVGTTPQSQATPKPLPTAPIVEVTPNSVANNETTVPQTMGMPQKQVIIRPVATSISDINAGLAGAKKDDTPIQQSVVGEEEQGDAEDVTFDYNALYGINSKDITDIKPQEVEEKKPIYTTQDIVIDNKTYQGTGEGFVPEFNAGDLDSNVQESNHLTDDVLNEKQMDKADTRKKIIYIGVIVVLIIVCIKFIFPLIAGYNM